MIDSKKYIDVLIEALKIQFDSRLVYVGLQGSYLRGEATEASDIDIMAVIDELDIADLKAYRSVIARMDHFDKSCGFICGKAELANWNPLEMCHLLHTTRDYFGCLAELIPAYTENDIRNFVKLSLNNLYHELCHRFIHADGETNATLLPDSYKAVFYILQNLHYMNHNEFVATRDGLLKKLVGMDHLVLERAMAIRCGNSFDFRESFELLFSWCSSTIKLI